MNDLAERRDEDVELHRLRDDHVDTVGDTFLVFEQQVPSGEDDDFHPRPVLLACLCHLEAIEPGHGEIGEDDIEGAPAECLDGPQPVLDGGHDEATVPQLIAHELAEVPSILGEEHTEIRPRISHADTPPEDMDRT